MMKKIFLTLAFLTGLLLSSPVAGQGIKDIRVNEVLVNNQDNFEDDYGHREGWIELFNSGHSTVDVADCYLVYVDGDGKTTAYRINKDDKRTIIPPQGYVIFIAEGTSTKGTFHTNFKLERMGSVSFYDQEGLLDRKGLPNKPISEIKYDVSNLPPDISIGFIKNSRGDLEMKVLPATTPNATNDISDPETPSERFRRHDPMGIAMTLVGMGVVFCALIILYLIFRTIGKGMIRFTTKKETPMVGEILPVMEIVKNDAGISGEELAAISMALFQYENDLHDIESTILTINKVNRIYSPWNSKIYGLRQMPGRK